MFLPSALFLVRSQNLIHNWDIITLYLFFIFLHSLIWQCCCLNCWNWSICINLVDAHSLYRCDTSCVISLLGPAISEGISLRYERRCSFLLVSSSETTLGSQWLALWYRLMTSGLAHRTIFLGPWSTCRMPRGRQVQNLPQCSSETLFQSLVLAPFPTTLF